MPFQLTDKDNDILNKTKITIRYNIKKEKSTIPSNDKTLTKEEINKILTENKTPEKSNEYFDDEYVLNRKQDNTYSVAVGTKKAITELSEEELEESDDEVVIPYKTITKTDDKLEVGEIRKTSGKNGAYNKRKYK